MISKNMALQQSPTVLLLLSFLVSETFAGRIIGGQQVEKYSIKYQASLKFGPPGAEKHYCGGTLVAPQWVVSAAHCWRPADGTRVVLSEHNLNEDEGAEQVLNVSKVFVHGFNYKTFNNDIMLLKLSQPAVLNANVQPAVLPNRFDPPLSRGICTVSGWGVTQIFQTYLSPVLRSVDVMIMNYCNYYYWGRISHNMMCAGSPYGGKDSCQGDSGGPLICNGKFEGIVSWGISCANPYFPGVYTKVRNYVYWINWIINNK